MKIVPNTSLKEFLNDPLLGWNAIDFELCFIHNYGGIIKGGEIRKRVN